MFPVAPVESVWAAQCGSQHEEVRTFPTGHATVLATFPVDGGGVRLELVGPSTEPTTLRTPRHSVVIGVRLQPWTLGAVIGGGAPETRDRRIELREVVRSFASVSAQLAGADVPSAIHRLVSEVESLASRRDPTVARLSAQQLEIGHSSVAQIAESAGVSTRHLERLVAENTGLTPTQLRLARRAERAADLLAAGVSPATTAYRAGFADQAHLTRSFKSLVGLTPTAFAAAECTERDVACVQDSEEAIALERHRKETPDDRNRSVRPATSPPPATRR